MIPLRLRLLNFMSYHGGHVLDFNGIHLACLSGENGSGKSTLLDATTWALWSRARGTSEELIHSGSLDMEVELEFVLDRNHYRVLRKWSKQKGMKAAGSSGHSWLDLQVLDGDAVRSLAGNTMRETQRRIDELLRIDYDTFVNSAFLLQGRADEFTRKEPGQRKQILAEILGLSAYDTLAKMARERMQERQNHCKLLATQQGEIEAELAKRPAYEEEAAKADAALILSEEARERQQALLASLNENKKELDWKEQQARELGARLASTEGNLRKVANSIRDLAAQLVALEALIARRQEIESGAAELERTRHRVAELNTVLTKDMALRERRAQREKAIEAARGALLAERAVLAQQVGDCRRQAAEVPRLEGDLEALRRRLAELAAVERENEERQERSRGLREELATLRQVNQQLREDMDLLKKKIEVLETGDARCPLCEQDLGAAERLRIAEKYQAEGKARGDLFRSNTGRSRECEEQLARLEQEIKATAERLRERAELQRRGGQLEQALREAQRASDQLRETAPRLAQLESRLSAGDFAMEERAALTRLLAELQSLAYDAVAHERVRTRAEELSRFDRLLAELHASEQSITQVQETVEQQKAAEQGWRLLLEQDRGERERLLAELEQRRVLLPRIEEAQRELIGLQQRVGQQQLLLGGLRQSLQHCDELERLKAVRQRELEEAMREKGVYEDLTLAFGRKGIQAMIIGTAISELEDEANALLGRMTDEQMSLRFDMQKGTKKGDVVETLDIVISDRLGSRDYDMFSGGEAFRIDFAVRVALSKLLAHRAGARLETLVIDEGFGTQDELGIDRLVQAIQAIQNDFARILVITHIADLKDRFPVRIEVTKTEDGSTFAVN